jgi:hypothetical protein
MIVCRGEMRQPPVLRVGAAKVLHWYSELAFRQLGSVTPRLLARAGGSARINGQALSLSHHHSQISYISSLFLLSEEQ